MHMFIRMQYVRINTEDARESQRLSTVRNHPTPLDIYNFQIYLSFAVKRYRFSFRKKWIFADIFLKIQKVYAKHWKNELQRGQLKFFPGSNYQI